MRARRGFHRPRTCARARGSSPRRWGSSSPTTTSDLERGPIRFPVRRTGWERRGSRWAAGRDHEGRGAAVAVLRGAEPVRVAPLALERGREVRPRKRRSSRGARSAPSGHASVVRARSTAYAGNSRPDLALSSPSGRDRPPGCPCFRAWVRYGAAAPPLAPVPPDDPAAAGLATTPAAGLATTPAAGLATAAAAGLATRRRRTRHRHLRAPRRRCLHRSHPRCRPRSRSNRRSRPSPLAGATLEPLESSGGVYPLPSLAAFSAARLS